MQQDKKTKCFSVFCIFSLILEFSLRNNMLFKLYSRVIKYICEREKSNSWHSVHCFARIYQVFCCFFLFFRKWVFQIWFFPMNFSFHFKLFHIKYDFFVVMKSTSLNVKNHIYASFTNKNNSLTIYCTFTISVSV